MIRISALIVLANTGVAFSRASKSVDDDSLKMLIVGVIFSLIHLLAPYLASYRERVEPGFSSLCGGFAAAFVFLELLPSIGDYHELIGRRIYGFILIGFAAFYGLECYLARKREAGFSVKTEYYTGMALAFLYNMLLAMTLGHQIPSSVLLTFMFSILIGFHLLSTDLGLIEQHPTRFRHYGRFTLVAAITIGLLSAYFADVSERMTDLVAATVAGIVLYRVLKHELPEFRQAHYRSFVAGAVFFGALHVILESN